MSTTLWEPSGKQHDESQAGPVIGSDMNAHVAATIYMYIIDTGYITITESSVLLKTYQIILINYRDAPIHRPDIGRCSPYLLPSANDVTFTDGSRRCFYYFFVRSVITSAGPVVRLYIKNKNKKHVGSGELFHCFTQRSAICSLQKVFRWHGPGIINGALSPSWQPVSIRLMQLADPVMSDQTVKNKYIHN